MKKLLLASMLGLTLLFGQLQTVWVTPDFLKKEMKIIDIRTAGEWRETGIINGAYTITFFDERGKFDIPSFLAKLNQVVKKGEQFALICRTGSRTTEVANFLSTELGYDVINLKGGMMKLQAEGYRPVPYKK